MARSRARIDAAPARISRRSLSSQGAGASRTAKATERQTRAAGYLVAPASPATNPPRTAPRVLGRAGPFGEEQRGEDEEGRQRIDVDDRAAHHQGRDQGRQPGGEEA